MKYKKKNFLTNLKTSTLYLYKTKSLNNFKKHIKFFKQS